MKKHNFLFIGECVIVVALLVLIGVLAKDEKRNVQGKESVKAVAELEEDVGEKTNFLGKFFGGLYEVLEEETIQQENEVEEEANVQTTKENLVENEKMDEDMAEELSKEFKAVKNTISDNNVSAIEEDRVKVVVFGDSIWDEGRGTDGISEQVMEQLDVEIYNCAIGGTAAAVDGEVPNREEWDSRSFGGMVYVAREIVDPDELMPNDVACQVIKTVDFNEVDYVIVSYGLNDYFSDITVYPQTYYDKSSYVGALRYGINSLQKSFPQLEVIITSPTYCEWFKGERQFELVTYVECARGVAKEMDVHFLDMYHALGKSPEEKMEYLSDGVHLTKEGRTLYAHSVVEYLKQLGVEEK